jgi:hypothetical protein
MQKSRFALLALSILAFIFLAQATLGQDSSGCTPQFVISSTDSVDASAESLIWIRVTVTNTGECDGTATVTPEVPDIWAGSTFITSNLGPGESENSSMKIIIPGGANSSVINLTAPGADPFPVKIIVGGQPIEGLSTSENKTQIQPPAASIIPITPAKNDTVIKVPQENAQQPNATGAVQNQPAGSVTGLVTANPSAQIAIFAILIFGAGYLAGRMKREGFSYRFRK